MYSKRFAFLSLLGALLLLAACSQPTGELSFETQNFSVGEAGCTPGYWKQEHHFGSWPETVDIRISVVPEEYETVDISPDTLLEDVFRSAHLGANKEFYDLNEDGAADTLLDALQFKGGPGVAGPARILLRAAVAALLNEAEFGDSYGASTLLAVYGGVNIALDPNVANADPSRDDILALAKAMDIANNSNCPLGNGDSGDPGESKGKGKGRP